MTFVIKSYDIRHLGIVLFCFILAIMKTYKNPRTQIGHKLSELNRVYHTAIPLQEIFDIIEKSGGLVIDESGQKWSGFLCGETGRAIFAVKDIKTTGLNLLWYRMPSGNYEITAYLM